LQPSAHRRTACRRSQRYYPSLDQGGRYPAADPHQSQSDPLEYEHHRCLDGHDRKGICALGMDAEQVITAQDIERRHYSCDMGKLRLVLSLFDLAGRSIAAPVRIIAHLRFAIILV
jgi:hypothetical protein